MTTATTIPGYTYGTDALPRSPVTLAELELMKKTVLFGAAAKDIVGARRHYAMPTRRCRSIHRGSSTIMDSCPGKRTRNIPSNGSITHRKSRV